MLTTHKKIKHNFKIIIILQIVKIPTFIPNIQIHPLQNNIHVSMVYCTSAFEPGASGLPGKKCCSLESKWKIKYDLLLPYYCTITCLRSSTYFARLLCGDKPKKKLRHPLNYTTCKLSFSLALVSLPPRAPFLAVHMNRFM